MSIDDVLAYWFGDWDDHRPLDERDPLLARWKDPGTASEEVRERFSEVHLLVVGGRCDEWEVTSRGALAKVVVIDQFSRALFHGEAKAFRWDAEARQTTQRALERAADRELSPIERVFLYLPLMHAEDRASHRRALALYSSVAEEAEEAGLPRADFYRQLVSSEVRLKEVIDRFGRYPDRNFALERTSTPEELEFLRELGGLGLSSAPSGD